MKRVVLVTGASGDIGVAIVKRLVKNENYILCLQYATNKTKAEQLESLSNRVHIYQDSFQSFDLVDKIVTQFGRIDALIHSVGILGKDSIENLTEEEFDSIFGINTKVPYLLTGKALPVMKKQKYGRIINISSIAVHYGMGRNTSIQYAGTKAALEALTTGVSRLGAEFNILANNIRPGAILSEMQKCRPDFEKRVQMVPVKRMGTVDEIAAMVEYLLSDKADFITGQTFTIAGGEG